MSRQDARAAWRIKAGVEMALGGKPPRSYLEAVSDTPEEAQAQEARHAVASKLSADLQAAGF